MNQGVLIISSGSLAAIETASTRAVELTIQCIAIQLPFVAEDNPGWLQLSSIRRWLGRTHGVTDRLPVFDGVTAINNYKCSKNSDKYLDSDQTPSILSDQSSGANSASSCWKSHGQSPYK